MAITRSMRLTYDQYSKAVLQWTTVATETSSCSYSEEWRDHESGQPMEGLNCFKSISTMSSITQPLEHNVTEMHGYSEVV